MTRMLRRLGRLAAIGWIGGLALTAPWPADAQTVVGVVYDSTRAAPLEGAEVRLLEADGRVVTDGRGVFSFEDLSEGLHSVTFTHPRLAVLGIEVVPGEVELRAGAVSWIYLSVPGRSTLSTLFCSPAAAPEPTSGRGMFIGRVVEIGTREPLAGAIVAVAWREGRDAKADPPVGAGPDREDEGEPEDAALESWRQARITVGADGRFAFCSVPSDGELRLQIAHGDVVQDPVVMGMPETEVLAHEFGVEGAPDAETLLDIAAGLIQGGPPNGLPRPTATDDTPEGQAEEPDASSEGAGTVTGRVTAAETGERVVAARVVIDGGEFSGLTDNRGRFWIADVPAGLRTLEVEYLGFSSRPTRLLMTAGSVVDTEVVLGIDPVPLPDIEVAIQRTRRGKLAGFEERRHRGIGRYLTREDIERRSHGRLHHIFQGLAGVRALPCGRLGSSPDCYLVVSGRRGPSLGIGSGPCRMSVYVDGIRWNLFGNVGINELHPDDIEAIEVYAGPATVPPRFMDLQSSLCGALVLWTRMGG